MKCLVLFSRKIRKNIISLSSAELAHRGVKVNQNQNWPDLDILIFAMLNKLRCHIHFLFSVNQITSCRSLIQIHILNDKQCRSRSVGFFRRQLIWICTVCKGRTYLGSAGAGLTTFFFCISGHRFSCQQQPYTSRHMCILPTTIITTTWHADKRRRLSQCVFMDTSAWGKTNI